MDAHSLDKERARRNLRTALILAMLALASATAFFVKVWQLS